MKRLTMTVALLTVISAALASGDQINANRATVVETHGSVYKVFYTNEDPAIVKIRLRDEDGKIIRTDRIKNKIGFMKPYNLTNLESGIYYFELKDDYGVVSKKVEIEKVNNNHMAVKTLNNNKYQVLVEQKDLTPLKLSIFNQEGELLHRETMKNKSGFSRIYDLSKFNSNGYVFQITDLKSTRTLSVE